MKLPKPTKIVRRRTKPTIKVKQTKGGLEIIKTMYDEFGKVLKKQVEVIKK